ncbi:hypothetical protein CRUP_034786 [Coryphaenoides rupestris]|nr:hypothetical protein CRUP_034786 [Coryphaenoides rupestris]
MLCEAVIPTETVEPRVSVYHDRVEFVGSSKRSNISILLWNITFEDEGEYVCFARNPKEKNRNHSAALVVHFILKKDDKNKECLVGSSAGVDNTENGHTTAKGADTKGTPKA